MAKQVIQEPTRILAEFAARLRFEDLPERSREHCKNLILDALACALAGHQGEETGQVRALASALAEGNESSVIGGGHLSLIGATLLNGYLITAVTMCDVHRATMTHSVNANVAWWISWSKPIVTKKRCQSRFAQSLDDMRLVM